MAPQLAASQRLRIEGLVRQHRLHQREYPLIEDLDFVAYDEVGPRVPRACHVARQPRADHPRRDGSARIMLRPRASLARVGAQRCRASDKFGPCCAGLDFRAGVGPC